LLKSEADIVKKERKKTKYKPIIKRTGSGASKNAMVSGLKTCHSGLKED
jgi:hypothetical protein